MKTLEDLRERIEELRVKCMDRAYSMGQDYVNRETHRAKAGAYSACLVLIDELRGGSQARKVKDGDK